MARLSKMFADAASATLDRLLGGRRRGGQQHHAPAARPTAPTVTGQPAEGGGPTTEGGGQPGESSPGQSGPEATVEVDPGSVGPVSMTYAPDHDGAPDPGEVVWTWVPFEENDGRGKDRPVLLVAAERGGTVLGVQLTSKRHDGADFVPVGAGGWDSEHRRSWANLDRVIRVHPGGMRREGTALPHQEFDAVVDRLARRYGWSAQD